jgi:gliding motility-associated-like protein
MTVVVNQIPTMTAPTNQTVCSGQSTAAITFSGSATTYSWSNSNTAIGLGASGTGDIASFTATNTTASPMTAIISVTPNSGSCQGTPTSFTIAVDPLITPTFPSWGPYCQNAIITQVILPTTSNEGITGNWSPAMISTSVGGNISHTFTPDPGQCADQKFITIVVNPEISPTFTQLGPFCENGPAINLPTSSNNTTPITGIWSPASINTSNVGTTTYTFTPNSGQCAISETMDIATIAFPSPTIFADVNSGCSPLTVNLTTPNVVGVNYSWQSNGSNIGSGSSIQTTFNDAGCYNISLTASANGCSSSAFESDYICVESDPIVSFTANPNILQNSSESIQFTNNTTGAVSYSWDFGDTTFSAETNPLHLYNNITSNILVTLTATSSENCIGTGTLVLYYNESTIFYVPNSFTPDQDEFNQTWGPVFTQGFDPYNFDLFVLNRWGEIIWESHDANARWDGTYGIKGKDCPDGVYTWKISYKPKETDEKINVSGSIRLIR